MTPKQIIVLMKMLDVTQTAVAKKLKVTTPAVHHVIMGLRRNPRIRRAIADAVHQTVDEIWPLDGTPTNNDTQINHTKNHKKSQRGK